MSDFVVAVIDFKIYSGSQLVTTQKLTRIKRIAAGAGPNGAMSYARVKYEGGEVENWDVTTTAESDAVYVRSVNDPSQLFELKPQDGDLCLHAL